MDILEQVNKYEVLKELDQKINILPIIISPCDTLHELFFVLGLSTDLQIVSKGYSSENHANRIV
jgi:hypothetical protein